MSKLFIGSLAWGTTKEDLEELFKQVGTVKSVNVITDRETGRSRGFGFVEMDTKEEAEAAIAKFNGTELADRKITVSIAEDKPKREGGGGGGFKRRDGGGGRGGFGGGRGREGGGFGGGGRGDDRGNRGGRTW
jgi:RNA recognition motif-containing protein